jgi:subtilisin family serine protease
VVVATDGQNDTPIAAYQTNSGTIQGHANAVGAAAVAAAFYFDTPQCGTTPAQLESYSSRGGAPILFSSAGARLATPELRQKPNFVGPDGANNTFLGFTLASGGTTGSNGLLNTTDSKCQNNPDYPNFFGTSSATPHAAGIAALLLQAHPKATPTQIYTALESSALPIGNVPTTGATPTFNYNAGYGFIQADAALTALNTVLGPPTPTPTAAPSSGGGGGAWNAAWLGILGTIAALARRRRPGAAPLRSPNSPYPRGRARARQ